MEDIKKTQIEFLEMKNTLYGMRRLNTTEEKINILEDSKWNFPKWSREKIDKWTEHTEWEDNFKWFGICITEVSKGEERDGEEEEREKYLKI